MYSGILIIHVFRMGGGGGGKEEEVVNYCNIIKEKQVTTNAKN